MDYDNQLFYQMTIITHENVIQPVIQDLSLEMDSIFYTIKKYNVQRNTPL